MTQFTLLAPLFKKHGLAADDGIGITFNSRPSELKGVDTVFRRSLLGLAAWLAAGIGLAEAATYRLSGVLISPSGRAALVNGKLGREGDWVDGAEIVAINEAGVRLRSDAGEFTVYLGSQPVQQRAAATVAPSQRAKRPRRSDRPALAAEGSHGPVQIGDTLSAIALRYRPAEVTLEQMMMALFEANPDAFGGNINVLYAGARLRVPSTHQLLRRPPAMAAQLVAQQVAAWRGGNARPNAGQATEDPWVYGPIKTGETLGAIALRMPDHATLNQKMLALFEANPDAFGGNINLLYAGASLKLPADYDLGTRTAEGATAEVERQTHAWRAGAERQAQRSRAPPDNAQVADESRVGVARLETEPASLWELNAHSVSREDHSGRLVQ